ncbi:hypothetical protein HPB52_024878 [Rhipicephalus sanguineus]|uniref:Kelch repeat protein n=1 Tax=Rhipicephalus sanguineus TaxID=34632 RepID=A0A9D4TDT8_RHISA|nr:hypothetical protein HPB52_024878 [Rhipicephalus sanguineus]
MACGVGFLGGMVYVVGGVTTKKQVFTGMAPAEVLSTVHATDPNERTFTDLVDVLAFDSLRGRWEFRFKLSRPRHAVAAANADDRVYVIGGMTCLEGASVEDVDVYHRQRLCFLDCQCLPRKLTGRVVLHYHVLKNRWDLCGMMPEPRSYHATVLIGNTVYVTDPNDSSRSEAQVSGKGKLWCAPLPCVLVIMGERPVFPGTYSPTDSKCGELVACKTTFAYDIDAMEWSRKADMKTGRRHTGGSFQGQAFRFRRQRTLRTVVRRSAATQTARVPCGGFSRRQAVADRRLLRQLGTGTKPDTNIYVIGGTSSVLNGPIRRPEVYLQQDDRYKFPAEYPEAMTGISAVSVPPVTPTFRSRSLTCMITDALAE